MTGSRSISQFLSRRWPVILLVVGVVSVAALLVAIKSYRDRSYVATGQIFVSAAVAPHPTGSGQAFDLERAARLMAEDLRDVAGSRIVASDIVRYLTVHHKGLISVGDALNAVSATNSGSTVSVSASASTASTARAVAERLLTDLSVGRARFVGLPEASRGSVRIVSVPVTSRTATREIVIAFGYRVILGLVVALGLALAWDFLDDSVHDPSDVERFLGVPILARVR